MYALVVFDTNVLFSGFGWRGNPYRCLQLAKTGGVESVTCREILAEFEEKLRLKLRLPIHDATQAVLEVISFSRLVTISNSLQDVADDPDDNCVLECAVVGRATHIVSGDHHLLEMKRHGEIAIVSAADFLALRPPSNKVNPT